MWSLFKKKEDSSDAGIGQFLIEGEKLPPLTFSNGKTQADVINDVLAAIEAGNKIIFIKGVCGTGKSAIALNLARHFDKTSIVVPIKSLQEQYEEDYSNTKFILKKDNKKLKISVIKGRQNFECPFLGGSADGEDLPCNIEIREKNMDKIKEFISHNPSISKYDFSSIKDVRRMSIAPTCPYWSPLMPSMTSAKALEKATKKNYTTVSGNDYSIYQRKKGCAYYDQYENYLNSDVLIFNSHKYIIELLIKRKPKTDIDIIDECDEFLDNFASERKINLSRLHIALNNIPLNKDNKEGVKTIFNKLNGIMFDEKIRIAGDIIKINESEFSDLIETILKYPHLAEDDEDNYYNKAFEIAKEFEPMLEETYVSFEKDKEIFLSLVTINLAKRFEEIVDSTKVLVLMSGTLHSEKVLKDIFGLEKFKVIEAETEIPGTITKFRTGLERNCKYENFKNGTVTRQHYLKALSACVENAKRPILVHVNSFEDLPNELEKAEYNLDNLLTKERLRAMQDRDKNNYEVSKFKSGQTDILFTTKCSRGIDFPGEKCNSIILTKYPYPNIQSLFWKILKKEKPDYFTEFYLDKSRRELIQKISRGLRSKNDHIMLLSPDSRILDANLR